MPIYEYKCRECGHVFEHLARRLSGPAPPCPKCEAKRPEKLLSVFSAATSDGPKPSCETSGSCCASSCPSGSCPYSSD